MKIEIKKINLKADTQSRIKINQNIIDEYTLDVKTGAKFPPVILFKSGETYYIGDGWHRVFAYKKAGKKTIDAEIKQGSKRDAVLYSVGANASHGLRRTNEDKRNSVTILLKDKEWAQWSNREIARQACVGESLVRTMRKNGTAFKTQSTVRKGTDGRTINTENIGQNAKKTDRANVASTQIETATSTEIAGAPDVQNDKAEFKKFKLFGWEIQVRKVKIPKKIVKTSEI